MEHASPRASSTVENYLKAIYVLEKRNEGQLVPLGLLAERLGVTAGTATTMAKRLDKSGLVQYESRAGVRLKPPGEELALDVLRRHRLVELFLVEVLDFDWGEVHEEAEILEHTISQRLLERIDRKLGYPKLDPHGDPIPDAAGNVTSRDLVPLSECEPQPVKIARITDQSPEFLRFLESRNLVPGTELEIVEQDEVADLVTLSCANAGQVQVGISAAAKILVSRQG